MAAIKDYSYTILFEPLERGGYQAIVPALPEIITVGRTLKEARQMARDAIRCALEGMAKEKVPFPREISTEPRTEKIRVSLRVPERKAFTLRLKDWPAKEQPGVDLLDRDKLFDLMNGR